MSDTGVVVLAAGNSSRMGFAKQTLLYRGKPMLRHAVDTAIEARCGPVVVVLGARASDLAPLLDGLPVRIEVNANWQQGMGGSIQCGLGALVQTRVSGMILTLADQPLIRAEFLASLVEQHRQSGRPIVAARYSGTVGVPAYFSQPMFAALQSLPPEHGCKGVIQRQLEQSLLVDCPEAAIDLDTPEDFHRLDSLTRPDSQAVR